MAKKLCVYHGNCDDGFASAYTVWKKFGDEVDFVAGHYHDKSFPDVKGKELYLVDFTYSEQTVLSFAEQGAKSIVILDHHLSAQKDLEHLHGQNINNCSITAIFDMDHSGVGVVWSYFFGDSIELPQLFKHIQDSDLWRFDLQHTNEIMEGLRGYPFDFKVWKELCSNPNICDQLKREGTVINRFLDKKIQELMQNLRFVNIAGYSNVPILNAPGFLRAKLGAKIIETQKVPFSITYFDTQEGRSFSLRGDGSFDTSVIAKQFNGGGHKNASGFVVDFNKLDSIFIN